MIQEHVEVFILSPEDLINLILPILGLLRQRLHILGQRIQLRRDLENLFLRLLRRQLSIRALQSILLAVLAFGSSLVALRLSLSTRVASLGSSNRLSSLL